MEVVVLIVLVVLIALVAYEYRLRKPDQIVVYETRDGVGLRSSRWYPRHVSLPITRATHSFTQTIEASAKGNLDLRVKVAVTVAASMKDLGVLLRVGGWAADAVTRAARELEVHLLGYVKEYTEQLGIEELSSEKLLAHLSSRLSESRKTLGLEVIGLTIASFEVVNPQIAEAIRQREHARILEQTETLNQQARIAAARTRLRADEEIARMESELELRRYELQQSAFDKQAALATCRAEHEARLKKVQLEIEREELQLLKQNPELLLLTPQAARLAEASQALRNARTVVSVGAGDAQQGTELLGILQSLVQGAVESARKRKAE